MSHPRYRSHLNVFSLVFIDFFIPYHMSKILPLIEIIILASPAKVHIAESIHVLIVLRQKVLHSAKNILIKQPGKCYILN